MRWRAPAPRRTTTRCWPSSSCTAAGRALKTCFAAHVAHWTNAASTGWPPTCRCCRRWPGGPRWHRRPCTHAGLKRPFPSWWRTPRRWPKARATRMRPPRFRRRPRLLARPSPKAPSRPPCPRASCSGAWPWAIPWLQAPSLAGAKQSAQDPDHIRADLQRVMDRHAFTRDAARPEAMAKRHAQGSRSARENIADLCDEGSFIEYGALAIAAQTRRRSMDDLIANTPADGMVTGMGSINGAQFGQERSRAVVMSYDATVLAGTQGARDRKSTDRMLGIALAQKLPVVLFAE